MTNLQHLNKSINNYERKKELQRRKYQEERRQEKLKEESFKKREESLLDEKKKLLHLIFSWKEEFLKTKQFSRIFRRGINELIILDSGWGHKHPEYNGFGCWSRLYLDKRGKLRYNAGYKWMPTGPEFYFENNQETIKNLTFDYLKELYGLIKSGKIYKEISKSLKEESELYD